LTFWQIVGAFFLNIVLKYHDASSHMASIEDIIKILNKGIRFGAVGRVHPKQIDEAAERILNTGNITWDLLEQIGRDVAGDYLLFNDVDVDALNKALVRKKKTAAEAGS
jgi:hypothetical protein